VLRYRTGEEILKGDRVRFHGNPAEIEFVATASDDPDLSWYVKEYGGGVMVLDPAVSGRTFIVAAQIGECEELEFEGRGEPGERPRV